MASRYALSEKKIAKWTEAGRGLGEGPAYKPWITIHDLSSKGRATRMHGVTAGREHHFLSDLEYAFGMQCDWDERVVDMREQYPLDRIETMAIASDIGVRHPLVNGCHPVMTTDLLLDLEVDGHRSQLAVAIKYVAELEDPKKSVKVIEKLELERRYWRDRGVAWALMTEREIPKHRCETYRTLVRCRDFEGLVAPTRGTWEERAAIVAAALPAGRGTLAAFCKDVDSAHGWPSGDALAMVWHLAATRSVSFDLDAGLDPRRPLAQLSLMEPMASEAMAA